MLLFGGEGRQRSQMPGAQSHGLPGTSTRRLLLTGHNLLTSAAPGDVSAVSLAAFLLAVPHCRRGGDFIKLQFPAGTGCQKNVGLPHSDKKYIPEFMSVRDAVFDVIDLPHLVLRVLITERGCGHGGGKAKAPGSGDPGLTK